jgi:translocator protein
MKKQFPWWQVGLASLAISAIGGLSSRRPKDQERKVFTDEMKQAPWAPPAWLFGPAWTVNNFFLLDALQQILRGDDATRRKLLSLQVPIWAIFFSFGYVYFNRKSPVLAAAWTVADAALAAASFTIAMKENKKLASRYVPLLGWTSFASTLAVYQALKNDDPVLKTEAVA